jgi:hypothetical protein
MPVQASPELLHYERRLPSLLADHEGEFVVIRGSEVKHFAADLETALTWAYEQYGVDSPVFVKQISADGGAVHLARELPL